MTNIQPIDVSGDAAPDAEAISTNGDGVLNGVVEDLNGDGVFDAIAVDENEDGVVDTIGVDTNGDGVIDEIETDSAEDGNWITQSVDGAAAPTEVTVSGGGIDLSGDANDPTPNDLISEVGDNPAGLDALETVLNNEGETGLVDSLPDGDAVVEDNDNVGF